VVDDWRSRAQWYWHRCEALSERDTAFLDTILHRFSAISDKPEKWLDDIEAKLRRDGGR
jgi:hypothetical protein